MICRSIGTVSFSEIPFRWNGYLHFINFYKDVVPMGRYPQLESFKQQSKSTLMLFPLRFIHRMAVQPSPVVVQWHTVNLHDFPVWKSLLKYRFGLFVFQPYLVR